MSLFEDRVQAGQLLAERLLAYTNKSDTLIFALPRGGVPVAFEVAKILHVPLDVFIVRKLGVPMQEELAVGAIAMGDLCVYNEDVRRFTHITENDLNEIITKEKYELARRNAIYRNNKPLPTIKDQTIILIDDGLATGATMRAAVAALRELKPAKLIVAVPVGPADTCALIENEVDEMICLETPEPFYGVGMWYADFSQTTDAEVCALLNKSKKKI